MAVIGSGQSGLLVAHGLVRAGYAVTVYSDRTPEQWLEEARPTGTAVRFARSLGYERELGLDDGHDEAPGMDGLEVTICSGPARPFLSLRGRFAQAPMAIDLRWQSARWMNKLQERGGTVVIERVTDERVEAIADAHDLTIVATGRAGGALFERDEARSPREVAARNLAMVNCVGPAMRFGDRPLVAAKFTVFEGLGECYWTPYYHKDQRPLWNLVFEARPGTPYDRFTGVRSAEEVLAISKAIVEEMMPWDADWLAGAEVADPHSWQVGSIVPTVRDPVRATSARGGPMIPLGDAYMSFDPLGAQGANMGNRLASTLVESIVARGDDALDASWIRDTYDAFYERWGGPAMRWTDLLLEPMAAPARYMLLAQRGAQGLALGDTPKQELADAFAANFDDPAALVDTLHDLQATRRWVSEILGASADWHAATGLFGSVRRAYATASCRRDRDGTAASPSMGRLPAP